MKTSYPLDEVDDIPDHDLPLSVHFKHTKVFDDALNPTGQRAAEKQLTTIFQVHGGPVVQAIPLAQSSYGTGNIDVTFLHPGSLRRFIDNNAWSALTNQRAMRMKLQLTTDISARPEELALWIGGCPDWNDDVEELKNLVKESLNLDFVLDFLDDPLRREILVVSPVAVNNVTFKMSLYNMVREALNHFEKNPIKWKRRKRLLLVKSASDLFVKKWKERLRNRQPLSTVETDLIQWTDNLLEKRARDLGILPPMRDVSPAPVRSPKKRQPQRRVAPGSRVPHTTTDDSTEPAHSPKKKQQKVEVPPSTSSRGESSASFSVESLPSTSTAVRPRIPDGWRGIGVKREFDEDNIEDSRDPYDQPGPSNAVMPGEIDSCPDDIAILDDEDSQSDSIEWLDDAGNVIGRQPTFSEGSSMGRSNDSPFNGETKKVGRKKGKKKVLLRCYMDPEEAAQQKLRYQQDATVRNLLRKLEKERRERGEQSVVIKMTFTKNDDASLKRRVNRMYKSLHKRGDLVEEEEDARKKPNGKATRRKWGTKYEGKTIQGNHKKYIIEGFPFSTPRKADGSVSYNLVTVMDDSQGPLECYATRQPTVMVHDGNGMAVEEQRRKNPDPAYTFIATNEKEESPQAEHLREKAKRCTVKCQCEGVCRLETCACMQQSVYQDGKVQEVLITDTKWMVYECCADCHCQRRKELCPSIVKYRKLKFHLLHFTNMGWALRVMEPVERGEPIVVFTGIYETEITEENKDWAYTCADCAEPWMRKFCGIDDDEAYMLLTPQHKGNSAGRICHSKASNSEFMKLYRGGVSTFEPECLIYASEYIEAGDLLWLDYGDAFWSESPNRECFCTQELCHDEEMNAWLRTLSKTQLFHVLKSREGRKRRRIQKSLQVANEDEGDEEINVEEFM